MAAAKLLALFHASLVLSAALVSAGTCGGQICTMDLPDPCIELKPDSCIDVCESTVGAKCLVGAVCDGMKFGPFHDLHCRCNYHCARPKHIWVAPSQSPRRNIHFLQ
ncbi:UNVERIFIED_CONTAM: hypothetical protein Sindi_0737800 [Sesamum indicum]